MKLEPFCIGCRILSQNLVCKNDEHDKYAEWETVRAWAKEKAEQATCNPLYGGVHAANLFIDKECPFCNLKKELLELAGEQKK